MVIMSKQIDPKLIPDTVEDFLDPHAEHVYRLRDKNDIGVLMYWTPPVFGHRGRHGVKKPPKPRQKP